MFPENDTQFNEHRVLSVETQGDWFSCVLSNKQVVCIPANCEWNPVEGDTIRLYGDPQWGGNIRGVFLNGQMVVYRTHTEYQEYSLSRMYGKDATDWLSRWDNNEKCWSLSTTALGPGYEQATQIAMAEFLRLMLGSDHKPGLLTNQENFKSFYNFLQTASETSQTVKRLNITNEQRESAIRLATHLFVFGPASLAGTQGFDRQPIQVQRLFPQG